MYGRVCLFLDPFHFFFFCNFDRLREEDLQQRRRTAEDSLQMRAFFAEGDLLSAEVQAVHHDGSVSLHTRSTKYGKLVSGQLLCVPQALIKRCKQHFLDLQADVSIILGNNGYIWLSRTLTAEEAKEKDVRDKEEDPAKMGKVRCVGFVFHHCFLSLSY